MRVRLDAANERTRIFEVVSADMDTAKGELTLTGRDGRICLGLVGAWDVSITASRIAPMSVDEIERLHEGRALVLTN